MKTHYDQRFDILPRTVMKEFRGVKHKTIVNLILERILLGYGKIYFEYYESLCQVRHMPVLFRKNY